MHFLDPEVGFYKKKKNVIVTKLEWTDMVYCFNVHWSLMFYGLHKPKRGCYTFLRIYWTFALLLFVSSLYIWIYSTAHCNINAHSVLIDICIYCIFSRDDLDVRVEHKSRTANIIGRSRQIR